MSTLRIFFIFCALSSFTAALWAGETATPPVAPVPESTAESMPLKGLNNEPLDGLSPPPRLYKWQPDSPPLPRIYVQQPPLIPHSIEGYQITLKANKCLTCHSWQNAKTSNATRISVTHFRDRDGAELDNISARRYFCTQCHIPQTDAQPLVENTFEPVEMLR